MSVTYKLPYDTPLRYLPLVYILPHDLLMPCPQRIWRFWSFGWRATAVRR